MLKVLILGHDSFVGKRLSAHLSKKFQVSTAGRRGTANYFIDLSRTGCDYSSFQPADVIVNCIANFAQSNLDDLVANETINSLGVLEVGRLAKQVNCRQIILLSSISALNEPGNQYFGSYGLSKKHGEENLEMVAKHLGVSSAALQFSQIYDEKGEAKGHQPLLYQLLDKARGGVDITIYGKADPLRNFIHVQDVVQIVEAAIDRTIAGKLACPHPISYKLSEIAALAYEMYATKGAVSFDHTKADIASVYIPTDLSAYDRLNFHPQIDMARGIALIRDRTELAQS